MHDAINDILVERRRQIEAEGWTQAHDDEHSDGEMAYAAACYAAGPEAFTYVPILQALWPWEQKWWKPGNDRRNLVKAGALIVAEIERLDRAASGMPLSEDPEEGLRPKAGSPARSEAQGDAP